MRMGDGGKKKESHVKRPGKNDEKTFKLLQMRL